MVRLICFRLEIPFLGKFGPKSQNCKFNLKFGTLNNSNIQLSQKYYWENVKISDHKCRFSILQIIAFLADKVTWSNGQITKQPLSNFEPENLENISNFQG